MPDLTMGANAPITDEHGDLVLEWPGSAGSLDCSAFLLGASGRVRSDDDMIFYNQPEGGGGAVRLESDEARGLAQFALDLRRVPSDVERIVVCATVDGGGRTMEAFAGLRASFGRASAAIRFAPDLRGAREAALRIVEFYRRGGGWKLRADGQGYNAGLGPLAESFGVDVEGEGAEVSAASSPASGEHIPELTRDDAADAETPIFFDVPPLDDAETPAPAARPTGTTVLRHGDVRSLRSDGSVDVVLSWSSREGGADGRARPLRPKLGAFYQLDDGRRGALQEPDARIAPSGDNLLSLIPPDDGGRRETSMAVAAGGPSGLARLHLYAVIDGPPSWRGSQVELLLTCPGSAPLAIELPVADDGDSCVSLAVLRRDRQGFEIECLVRGATDQRSLDAEFGWELRWRSPGRP